MKKLKKENKIIIAEIILLCVLTFFIAKPIFMLGVKLFFISTMIGVNYVVGYFLMFFLIFSVDVIGLLIFKFLRLKYSVFLKLIIAYLLLIVNIGYFSAFIGMHLLY